MQASPKISPDAEERTFSRRYSGLFAGLFLIALAVLAFVVLRGA